MYRLLEGTRVLEISLLAPDSAGQHLADLGAEVIKVEGPPRGDYVRNLGNLDVDGVSTLHLRWNRGKRSIWLDLKSEEGRELFLALAGRSQVVIDGLRWGVLERLGVGYERLREANPALVYCSLSGLGRSGPYSRLATHGVFYDAFAGLAPPVYPADDGIPRIPGRYTAVGIEAAGLYAALAILAALASAARTGTGTLVEVAEADAAAVWSAGAADARLNGVDPGLARSIEASVRYSYYRTKDDRLVIFQASEAKFWENFCHAVDREDLLERFPSAPVGDHSSGNEELRWELQEIFLSKIQAEWTALFIEANVPGGPVYTDVAFLDDPHFKARQLTYGVTSPDGRKLRLMGTPIKVADQTFEISMAPSVGQDTEAVMQDVLEMTEEQTRSYLAGCPPMAQGPSSTSNVG